MAVIVIIIVNPFPIFLCITLNFVALFKIQNVQGLESPQMKMDGKPSEDDKKIQEDEDGASS